LEIAQQFGCDAIHPGYGFLAENAAFAEAAQSAGLIFIGPGAEAIRLMGSKTEARALLQSTGVPVVPGYQESNQDDDLLAAAKAVGYPLLVKATAGGGGKGMRLVESAAAMPDALQSARREAQNAFGDSRVYLEKYIAQPRHIEFQIFGDSQGNVAHLFERECSVQRRHQKIIEETPSPFLDDTLRQKMGEAAVAAAKAVNYQNAGTVEFIVDPAGAFYFLEMNTRLQVEHPVTELVTGLDLVKLQLRVAAGEPLPFNQADLSQRGHAIECRIYAEDPANGFLPDIGPVLRAVEPQGPGIRVDSGVVTGDEITVHYDPLIAKVIALGESRGDALRKMDWALRQYIILGVATNIPFLRAVINHQAFQHGETTTHFIEQYFANWQSAETAPPDLVFAAAAISDMLEQDLGAPIRVQAEEQRSRGAGDGDVFSPWGQLRGFRMGA
jgi:acetyl/propionyl-CoA carboxylase alpha subunit